MPAYTVEFENSLTQTMNWKDMTLRDLISSFHSDHAA